MRAERDPDIPDSWACQTARFGVVYNTGCCRQVFEAALGRFTPHDRWWHLRDGRLQDPYRAGVFWNSAEDAENDLRNHAECVRRAVERCDVFIVPPGLSEVWKNRAEGSTYAAAPPREVYNPELHSFELIDPDENNRNLDGMYRAMREINPELRLVIAMSPVPLTATFRPMHWAAGNAVSKASLRVAVDRFCSQYEDVIYFPSYEIITSLTDSPFETDNLHVRLEHVERIMTTFMFAYGDLDITGTDAPGPPDDVPIAWEAEEPSTASERLVVDPLCSMRLAYLRETWQRLGYQYESQPVAIAGAGAHTSMLCQLVQNLDGPNVVCVLDDHPAAKTIGDWPVRRFKEEDAARFAAVIVSSDSARERLTSRTRAWANGRTAIETLYDGLPAGPYPTADTARWVPASQPAAPAHDWATRMAPIPGWLKDHEAELLFRSASELAPLGRIVEIGSFMGRSTVCLASGLNAAQRPQHETVLAIDPHVHAPSLHPLYEPQQGRTPDSDAADPRRLFEHYLHSAGVHGRVEILQAYSSQCYAREDIGASLVFIDGDHSYEAAAADIAASARWLVPGGRMLVHDYGSWDGVTRAVDECRDNQFATLLSTCGSIAVLHIH